MGWCWSLSCSEWSPYLWARNMFYNRIRLLNGSFKISGCQLELISIQVPLLILFWMIPVMRTIDIRKVILDVAECIPCRMFFEHAKCMYKYPPPNPGCIQERLILRCSWTTGYKSWDVWMTLKTCVAHGTTFYTPPDQLFIINIILSSLLLRLYLANTYEYQAMYFHMYTWIDAQYFLCLIFWKSFAIRITDTEKCNISGGI